MKLYIMMSFFQEHRNEFLAESIGCKAWEKWKTLRVLQLGLNKTTLHNISQHKSSMSVIILTHNLTQWNTAIIGQYKQRSQ